MSHAADYNGRVPKTMVFKNFVYNLAMEPQNGDIWKRIIFRETPKTESFKNATTTATDLAPKTEQRVTS